MPSKIVVLGSGAREHALAWAMSRSPGVSSVVVAPGNAGMNSASAPGRAAIVCAALSDLTDVNAVLALARAEQPDLVVVGPEAPLCAGVADALSGAGFSVFGPRQNAARVEGSKAFMKELALSASIPTARCSMVHSFEEAERVIRERGAPIVVKADGLCAGKGVVVAHTEEEALDAARTMLVEGRFGEAGKTVLLEDMVLGEELSVHAVCDGKELFTLLAARDHKRIFDGDRGPNTGGMGAYAPVPEVSDELYARIEREILKPALEAMNKAGSPFVGALFAGLMLTPEGDPVLLEFNARFGDPECEVLCSLIDGDFAGFLASAARGHLDRSRVSIARDRCALGVVLASAGYPGTPRLGDKISGLEQAAAVQGVQVFHAGTRAENAGVVTAGGRVLTLTATGNDFAEAKSRAYEAVSLVSFEGMQFRRDIGGKALRKEIV